MKKNKSLMHLRGAAARHQYRQAAGAIAEAVIRSVELVQPDAEGVIGCCAVQADQRINRTYSSARREGCRR
jgi:hypothetical protein